MEALRREFEARPGRAVVATRELLARANGLVGAQRQNAEAFLERRGRSPSDRRWLRRTSVMSASVGNVFDMGDAERLGGRTSVVRQYEAASPSIPGGIWHAELAMLSDVTGSRPLLFVILHPNVV